MTAYAPVLLVVAYMLPRLWSAHFGFLDDPVTLHIARNTLRDPASALHAFAPQGRFLPFFCLYWAIVYVLCGPNPLLC